MVRPRVRFFGTGMSWWTTFSILFQSNLLSARSRMSKKLLKNKQSISRTETLSMLEKDYKLRITLSAYLWIRILHTRYLKEDTYEATHLTRGKNQGNSNSGTPTTTSITKIAVNTTNKLGTIKINRYDNDIEHGTESAKDTNIVMESRSRPRCRSSQPSIECLGWSDPFHLPQLA